MKKKDTNTVKHIRVGNIFTASMPESGGIYFNSIGFPLDNRYNPKTEQLTVLAGWIERELTLRAERVSSLLGLPRIGDQDGVYSPVAQSEEPGVATVPLEALRTTGGAGNGQETDVYAWRFTSGYSKTGF